MNVWKLNKKEKMTRYLQSNNKKGVLQILNAGFDPNFEGGWPLRLAARHGSSDVVKILLQWGANPHLRSKAEASILQLAVYSGLHWEEGANAWELLLSCCDSSQLADGAAVAVVFKRLIALKQILRTGRCNTNVPTTLTGRTVESLAKGYKLEYVLKEMQAQLLPTAQCSSPTVGRLSMISSRESSSGPSTQRTLLSPSVAQFFEQTAHQTSLSPQNLQHAALSPTTTSAQTQTVPSIFTSPIFSIPQ